MVGNRAYLEELGVAVDLAAEKFAQRGTSGSTLVWVAVNGLLRGLVAIADDLKPGVASIVDAMRQRGWRVLMLTGDQPGTAQAIADKAHISEVHASLLPADKMHILKELRASGCFVAMVGDGINDAPAMAAADLGMAMASGSDIAVAAADVTLLRSSLDGVVASIEIGSRAVRSMRQNLFWAFAYNLIGIPVAAGVLYPHFGVLLSPVVASAAMALSSFSVVSNSLRIRR